MLHDKDKDNVLFNALIELVREYGLPRILVTLAAIAKLFGA